MRLNLLSIVCQIINCICFFLLGVCYQIRKEIKYRKENKHDQNAEKGKPTKIP
jgi:tellurite resistance protein TehA-like permease